MRILFNGTPLPEQCVLVNDGIIAVQLDKMALFLDDKFKKDGENILFIVPEKDKEGKLW